MRRSTTQTGFGGRTRGADRQSKWDIFAARAAADLDDESLRSAELPAVKEKATERVSDLINGLENGDFGACKFDAAFRKTWPYAQGHFGKQEEPTVEFPELIKAVANHPLALQHDAALSPTPSQRLTTPAASA